MKNQSTKQEELKTEEQDSVSIENKKNAFKASNKTVISIKDVIEKHPTSKATHDLPLEEQQYDIHQKIKEND